MRQGYNARLDESMAMRNGKPKKQAMKARRNESEGMEKASGKKKYAAVKSMAKPKTKVAKRAKVKKVMDEFSSGELHSGSKKGPMVKNRKQAIAIALSEAGMSKKKRGMR